MVMRLTETNRNHQPATWGGRGLALIALLPALILPALAVAQSSPFMTGAAALQSNILAWMTPIAVIVENCANTLILRCSGSEQGGTSQFASRLIGEREVIRRQRSRGRDRDGLFGARGTRRSSQVSEQQVIESAVLASELEQLPDLAGYFKSASSHSWTRIGLRAPARR
jgi:hypothetical protein